MLSKGWLAGSTSTMVVAGIGWSDVLESMPKGALVLIAMVLLAAVSFFAKRDWNALNGKVSAHDDRFAALDKRLDERLSVIERRMQDLIDVPSYRAGESGQWDTINQIARSQAYIAGKLGLPFELKDKDAG